MSTKIYLDIKEKIRQIEFQNLAPDVQNVSIDINVLKNIFLDLKDAKSSVLMDQRNKLIEKNINLLHKLLDEGK
jgi:hypothetical protein